MTLRALRQWQQRVWRQRRSNNRPQRGLENKGRQARVWPTRPRRTASLRRRRCQRPRRQRRLWPRRLQFRKRWLPLLGGYCPESVAETVILLIQIAQFFFATSLCVSYNLIKMSLYSVFTPGNITHFLNVIS